VTPEQTELVRRSFDAIWPVRRKLADQFYRRFFELAPDAQGLFRSDMERQYLKLMDMIAAIVGTLDKREMFQSIISHSGRQHAQFGAKPLHFAAFGDALIWGLEQQFGAAFTPEMKEAWIKLYDDVQREMMCAGLPGKDRVAPDGATEALMRNFNSAVNLQVKCELPLTMGGFQMAIEIGAVQSVSMMPGDPGWGFHLRDCTGRHWITISYRTEADAKAAREKIEAANG
jgi:hemoglobin-like flavoprotein